MTQINDDQGTSLEARDTDSSPVTVGVLVPDLYWQALPSLSFLLFILLYDCFSVRELSLISSVRVVHTVRESGRPLARANSFDLCSSLGLSYLESSVVLKFEEHI